MFLTVKKGTSTLLCLEAAEATLATVYASINEQYKNLELEVVFNKPEGKVFYNIISFVRELDKMVSLNSYSQEEDTKIESIELAVEEKIEEIEVILEEEIEELTLVEEPVEFALTEDSEDLVLLEEEIEEPINFLEEETELVIEETPIIAQEPKVEVKEVKEIEVPKVPNTPGDKMMESLKEQQKTEGLLELEGDKVNTLAYREHLINYMKLGFASSMLKKKVKDCNDTSEQSKLLNFCENVDKRTEEYEMKFKEIGLTTGQVYTFRMEVLRDIRKYQDDSIRQICDYINKLYALSDSLIVNLK
ncbi:MAG: hypothetical protein ACRC6T_06840 [Sarcina sp.]